MSEHIDDAPGAQSYTVGQMVDAVEKEFLDRLAPRFDRELHLDREVYKALRQRLEAWIAGAEQKFSEISTHQHVLYTKINSLSDIVGGAIFNQEQHNKGVDQRAEELMASVSHVTQHFTDLQQFGALRERVTALDKELRVLSQSRLHGTNPKGIVFDDYFPTVDELNKVQDDTLAAMGYSIKNESTSWRSRYNHLQKLTAERNKEIKSLRQAFEFLQKEKGALARLYESCRNDLASAIHQERQANSRVTEANKTIERLKKLVEDYAKGFETHGIKFTSSTRENCT